MNVGDLMSTQLITIEPEQDLGVVLALMHEFDIHSLPVVERATGRLVGIISARDVRLAIDSPFSSPDDEQAANHLESVYVGEVMSTSLVVIGPGATVGDAARRMLSHKVNGLPVVQMDNIGNTRLIGLITTSDLLRYLADLEGDKPVEG
ncbi:MAG: CBS domain-containing protein [Ardenticatenales bacterium]|nr:CBS domain-containing protein [Ardenticatenales bacterium]